MSNDPTESHIPQPNGNSPSDSAAAEEAMIERARIALESSPETIGPYRIIEKLGQGGMGEVYRAEQRVPIRRQVAIKLIKLGMDTKQVIARFEAERQALALMDHPHIAKVLDASTDDSGRPYFVMEYVKGVPIHEYADKNQLTIQERLGLFGQVCHAIQHAHHKGVIHRDIKPSNVLTYTQDGKPHAKIIDFGIAKAIAQQLTDQTFYTLHTQFLGTPQYMSPEQAEGNLDIDTRTDVYSLGVMLYELLTGTTPFSLAELKANAVDQIRKIICETEPPKPSTRLTIETATLNAIAAARRVEPTRLGSLVRGELDWIVMMALDKDRRRRYDTPNDLADDIEAYLQGERVKAAPPSRLYLMQKFAKRNKRAVAVASILTTSLGIGLAGTSWQWYRADRNAKTAELSSAEAKVARQRAEDALAQAEKQRELAIEQRDNAEFEAYVANLNFANGAVERGEYQEAQEYLKRCPEQHRGWEWDFLTQMSRTVSAYTLDSMCIEPNGRAAITETDSGSLLLYTASSLGNPVVLEYSTLATDEHIEKLLMSQDRLVVCLETNTDIYTIAMPGRMIATESKDALNAEKLLAVSSDGTRLALQLNDGTCCLVNTAESIMRTEATLPALGLPTIVGFISLSNSETDELLIVSKDRSQVFAFKDATWKGQQIKPTELVDFANKFAPQLQVQFSNVANELTTYLPNVDRVKRIVSYSNNRQFCVVERDDAQLQLMSIVTQTPLATLPTGKEIKFSADNSSLWILDDDGGTSIYKFDGHSSLKEETFGRKRLSANARPITSNIVFEYGIFWNRDGLKLNARPVAKEFYNVVAGDRIVSLSSTYDHGILMIDDLPHGSEFSERPNAEVTSLLSGNRPDVPLRVPSGKVVRNVYMGKYGFRFEDADRSRFITEIRCASPSKVKAILLSHDNKRIFIIGSDNSSICYDVRKREEISQWNELVFTQLQHAASILDLLWESDTNLENLRTKAVDISPAERGEAFLQLLDTRLSTLAERSTRLFNSKRYQYVGRKEDMLTEIASQCFDSRMYRAGGPMVGLIESWSGEPKSDDARRFKYALLQNELEPNLREHLAEITQGYLAADPLPDTRKLTAALGFLRCGDFKASKGLLQPLLENGALSEYRDYEAICLCCASILAMHAGDVGGAARMFDEAEIARNSAITEKQWDKQEQMFFEETRAKLEAFRESSKEEK